VTDGWPWREPIIQASMNEKELREDGIACLR
jgi:hypothetical protein